MTVGLFTARLGLLKEAVVDPRTLRTFGNYARLGRLAKFITKLSVFLIRPFAFLIYQDYQPWFALEARAEAAIFVALKTP